MDYGKTKKNCDYRPPSPLHVLKAWLLTKVSLKPKTLQGGRGYRYPTILHTSLPSSSIVFGNCSSHKITSRNLPSHRIAFGNLPSHKITLEIFRRIKQHMEKFPVTKIVAEELPVVFGNLSFSNIDLKAIRFKLLRLETSLLLIKTIAL